MPSNNRKTKTVRSSSRRKPTQQPQLWRRVPISRPIVLALFVLASTVGLYYGAGLGHAAQSEIRSGVGGNLANNTPGNECLDASGGIYPCNGSAGEKASFDGSLIHVGSGCAVEQGATSSAGIGASAQGRAVVISACNQSNGTAAWGAVWTKQGGTFHNRHAESSGGQYCLDVKGGASQGPVELWTCKSASANLNQRWYPDTYGSTGGGSTAGDQILSVAASQVGVHEWTSETNSTPGSCNCGGQVDVYTQHHAEWWCNDFAQWAYYKAGYGLGSRSSYVRIGDCSTIAAWFGNHGHYWSNNSTNRSAHTPQAGDFVKIDGGNHCAIVDHVSNGVLYTIDGNYLDAVTRVHRTLSSTSIDGWGRL